MAGWIKIDTEITKHWLWQDAERLKWWLDMLIMAAWKDHKQLVGKQLVTLRRGQFIASLSFLCKRWGRSRSMVEPFLDLLQKDGMISKEVDKNISVISVLNYEKYQATADASLDTYLDAQVDAHLEVPQSTCKSKRLKKSGVQGDAHLDTRLDADLDAHPDATIYAHLDADLDAHLKQGVTSKNTESCKDDNTSSDAHLDATKDASLDATIEEYIIDNNISSSSFHSEDDSSNSKLDQPQAKMDLSKFIKFFNDEMDAHNAVIPRLRTIAGTRKNHILARCREFGKEAVAEMVRKAARSDFLNGKNPRGWVANFSWMILPNNFPKVIEGNYDNNQRPSENGISKQEPKTQRRGVEVEASSAEDYKTSF